MSPTEPSVLRRLGVVSLVPEEYGVDVFWAVNREDGAARCGVQRKRFPEDFMASLADGRLQKELQQMKSLDVKFLLIEGSGTWTVDKCLVLPYSAREFTSRHLRGMLATIQCKYGVGWIPTTGIDETVEAIRDLHKWSEGDKSSLETRPKPGHVPFNDPASDEWKVWWWQGIPGIGSDTAWSLVKAFPGGLPVKLAVSEKELREVKGVGKKKARDLVRFFGEVVAKNGSVE